MKRYIPYFKSVPFTLQVDGNDGTKFRETEDRIKYSTRSVISGRSLFHY